MTEIESLLCEIRCRVDNTKQEVTAVSSQDLLALAEFSRQDRFGALLLAIKYGVALSEGRAAV